MKPYFERDGCVIYHGDTRAVLPELPAESVHCVVTSPPYWGLRDYGVDGQLGLERTPEEYVEAMVGVFREVRRVLKDAGTLWLNLGDSYAGAGPSGASYESETTKRRAEMKQDGAFRLSKALGERGLTYRDKKPIAPPGLKPKDLVGIPWRLAFALQADGWWLRSDIIWSKPNPMPESVTDRPTKSHEYLFLLTKAARYYYDADAVREDAPYRFRAAGHKVARMTDEIDGLQRTKGGFAKNDIETTSRNLRDVWTIPTQPYPGAHFATFPPKLVEPCLKAGCPVGGTVLDPFWGAGTVGVVAQDLHLKAIGIELNADYIDLSTKRLAQGVLPFGDAK